MPWIMRWRSKSDSQARSGKSTTGTANWWSYCPPRCRESRRRRRLPTELRLQHLPRVHQPLRIQRRLDGAHGLQRLRVLISRQLALLELAYAVLGAEAASQLRGQVVDALGQVRAVLTLERLGVFAGRRQQVVVEVAVADVAVDGVAALGNLRQASRRFGQVLGDAIDGDGDVVLHRAALVLLRLRDGLAQPPELLALLAGLGDDAVGDLPLLHAGHENGLADLAELLIALAGRELEQYVVVVGVVQGV